MAERLRAWSVGCSEPVQVRATIPREDGSLAVRRESSVERFPCWPGKALVEALKKSAAGLNVAKRAQMESGGETKRSSRKPLRSRLLTTTKF